MRPPTLRLSLRRCTLLSQLRHLASPQIDYGDVVSATLTTHRDGTGTFVFTKIKAMYQPTERITFDRVRDVKGAVRVLAKVLPSEVAEDAGFAEG